MSASYLAVNSDGIAFRRASRSVASGRIARCLHDLSEFGKVHPWDELSDTKKQSYLDDAQELLVAAFEPNYKVRTYP